MTRTPAFGANPSSIILTFLYNPALGLLAQLVEQLTLNQRVVGSIPSQPTNFSSG